MAMDVEPVQSSPCPWCWQAVVSVSCGLFPLLAYWTLELVKSASPDSINTSGIFVYSLPPLFLGALIFGVIGITFSLTRRLRGISLAILGIIASAWWFLVFIAMQILAAAVD
ncbi:MAG: hypothetical protein ACYC6A_25250 [Armatimonadota bacterium]